MKVSIAGSFIEKVMMIALLTGFLTYTGGDTSMSAKIFTVTVVSILALRYKSILYFFCLYY